MAHHILSQFLQGHFEAEPLLKEGFSAGHRFRLPWMILRIVAIPTANMKEDMENMNANR